MKIPGFNAEESLYQTGVCYYTFVTEEFPFLVAMISQPYNRQRIDELES
jgi:hypothetical protein